MAQTKRWALDVVRELYNEAADTKLDEKARKQAKDHAKRTESARSQDAMLELAKKFLPLLDKASRTNHEATLYIACD